MMLSNLNLSSLPECNFEVRYVDRSEEHTSELQSL